MYRSTRQRLLSGKIRQPKHRDEPIAAIFGPDERLAGPFQPPQQLSGHQIEAERVALEAVDDTVDRLDLFFAEEPIGHFVIDGTIENF
ncbi:hypothetical protein [Methylobacterium sp. ap11]|uniref:hypothetical protein n=1 Tax=Methylobacterium sp. ap11 TaxID=1761799 RepID=UPI001160C0FA|nr:hypothetical protein [Methylobacterium sp. ap11]